MLSRNRLINESLPSSRWKKIVRTVRGEREEQIVRHSIVQVVVRIHRADAISNCKEW